MSSTALILIIFVIANLPWLTDRIFLVYPVKHKSVLIRLIELVIYYLASLLIAIAAETHLSGDIFPQQWEFFVTTFCLFLVLSVPSVIYRYQWLPMTEKKSG